MVSNTRLARISSADDIDLNQNMISLGAIGYPNWVVFSWYRDVSYANDEYGCTAVPNIFHLWAVNLEELNGQTPPNVPHVNLLGSECTPHWVWGNILAFARNGHKYIAVGGGRCTGSSMIAPRIVIIDVSDITNPDVVKTLEDSGTRGANNYIAYCPDSDAFYVQTSDNVLRRGTFDEVVSASSLTELTEVKSYSEHRDIIPVSLSKALICSGSECDVLDMVSGSIVDTFTKDSGLWVQGAKNLFFMVFDSSRNVIGVRKYDPDTLTVLDTYTLTESIPSPDPNWARAIHVSGDIILYVVGNTMYVINFANKQVSTKTLPIGVGATTPIPVYNGKLVMFEVGDSHAHTNGWLDLVELDDYIYIVYDSANRRIRVVDKNGNPVANRTVYIAEVVPSTWIVRGIRPIGSRTTDQDGYVDISDLSGMLRIEA